MDRQQPTDGGRDAASIRSKLWNDPRCSTLVEMIETPARNYGESNALVLCNHGREEEPVTWGELWNEACATASGLRRAGVSRGDRVLLAVPTSRAFFQDFFGALVRGAIPVPLAPPASLRPSRLESYIEYLARVANDCTARCLLTSDRAAGVVAEALSKSAPQLQVYCASEMTSEQPIEIERPEPRDTAVLQYASGSTSDPKGVVLTHENLLANSAAIVDSLADADTIGFSWLPLHHDMGLIGTCLSGLYCRAPLAFMPPQAFVKDPASWLRGISHYRATVTVAPNSALEYCADRLDPRDLPGVRLDSVKVILNGAEPVIPEVVERFEAKFRQLGLRPETVRAVYGLAESSLAVTFADPGECLIDVIDADLLEKEGRAVPAAAGSRTRRFVSVGPPIKTQQVRIIDSSDEDLAERRVGEVVVRGPSIMKGYFNRPEDSARALRNGWLHTEDLGYMTNGRLFLTGRSKAVIIRYGRNFYAQDIEAQAASVSGILGGRAAAFSVGEEGSAKVVVVAESRVRDSERISKITRLIKEKCHDAFLFTPDEVRLVPPGAIPTTTSGKVRRHLCKSKYLSGDLVPAKRDTTGKSLTSRRNDPTKADSSSS